MPQDLSIVGFDNREITKTPAYSVTTVDGGLLELGSVAARRLVRLVEAGAGEPTQTYVTPKLIVRGSTAAAPEGALEAGNNIVANEKER